MELIAIFLSGILALVSPVGLVLDRTVESAIRSRFDKIEQLQVRIDNAPNYQIVQGKVERVRVAGRGFWLTPEIRIAALELETDPLDIDVARLQKRGKAPVTTLLEQPLQGGLRLVITQEDINQALLSPAVTKRLSKLASRLLGSSAELIVQRYEFVNPKIELLGNNRVRLQLELQEQGADKLSVSVETGVSVAEETKLQLIEPSVLVNNTPVPPPVVAALLSTLNDRLDLSTLDDAAIALRILKLDVNREQLEVAAFVKVKAPTAVPSVR